MPACLHILSHSQADEEISFVHPHTLWWVLSDGLSSLWHSLVVVKDAENEVCIWIHRSLMHLFPCSPVIGGLLVFNSSWEAQTWCDTTWSGDLKALNTNASEMPWLHELVPELQAVSFLLLSSTADFCLSFHFFAFYQKQTKYPQIFPTSDCMNLTSPVSSCSTL